MSEGLDSAKGGGEVMPVSPTDAKAWELVHSVLEWMGKNHSYNYSEAFRQLGVAPASFYRAVKRPFVQNRLLRRFRAQDAAEVELLDAYWLGIVGYQVRMATGQEGSPRESTGAARFVHERRRLLRERLESQVGEQEGQSEASIILQRFKERYGDGMPVVKARRRVTEEEIEVAPG